ncbi:MAG: hypothetical protein WAW17_10985 [Rhodococcus sp. (in: high G+C Gram-positive bacteria)]|uniref:hypothetical protein n=1 Tax=Rhodococcus sp. TaxID=1831 RepID=UPI003BAF4D87
MDDSLFAYTAFAVDPVAGRSSAGRCRPAVRFGKPLFLQVLRPSIGSVADTDDDPGAEATLGLYKAECIAVVVPFRKGPLRAVSTAGESTST